MANSKKTTVKEPVEVVKEAKDEDVIDILGTEYTIEKHDPWHDPALEECDGYCDDSIKLIVINSYEPCGVRTKGNLQSIKKRQLRHEIIHAFLSESGLGENSSWAHNEEIVDYFARMWPKMKAVFDELRI